MSIFRLDRQPEFPYEDLSRENAYHFADSMDNAAAFDARYAEMDLITYPYHRALQVIQAAALPHIPEHAHPKIHSGMRLYEVVSSLVRPPAYRTDLRASLASRVPPLEHELKTNLNATSEIQHTFVTRMERMTMAIGLAAVQLWDMPFAVDARNYFVAGAALAHRLESDARRS